MRNNLQFYIDGAWVAPNGTAVIDVINPADATIAGQVALGDASDVERAVSAARKAFETYSVTSIEERVSLFDRIIASYEKRAGDLARAVTDEMGAPQWLSEQLQVTAGLAHFQIARASLPNYRFDEPLGTSEVVREPIGVCALITPWNWPLMLMAAKVAPALAAGCTVVLKPSEVAPFSGTILTEILHDAGVPKGVFNLVHGDGRGVGNALTSHPDVDLVSFTGSTKAGIEVARTGALTVKRVHQELGGKSPNIILPSADLASAIEGGVAQMMLNGGQSCSAPSRMLVHVDQVAEAIQLAKAAAETWSVGHPSSNAKMGPVASEAQWNKIQGLIQSGLDEGATLVTGGLGRPDGLDAGFYVKPTIFADVHNDMTIAREEIFGPVLVIIAYSDEEDAVKIANDTTYGLAAYVQGERAEAEAIGRRLRAGQVYLNNVNLDLAAPFGGYKQSGNGREWGPMAIGEFLEIKAIIGFRDAA
ncbi:aldehyde dehydrogenase family protein [Agrobacterium tumefaciens]|uniref:aldehyde dehydrogenase family protein n=1 Tax=Agrobacterium tumefaciens TaxID=358 RepID=UPI001574543B|nr:aldehyde dehydrogenase family protein [Agrobacterium tumefaciens]NTD87676.1 aldehyde dehydrogenase family protein [Agrobacterium tumefaciens]NTD91551.1 aldehyde dehydrogenase family protein [Agrobacterium tumefaciens]NTD95536.1 aldehyde dehydrogenase family protein [Agrobacterium tumefaciens]NTE11646.1 aldehyde dehydrogenase family protein [Agrobacterium tumefaciens]NTE25091.1 aldehyde dehydrogenase family protein [Agrobacterium tumefaciens]